MRQIEPQSRLTHCILTTLECKPVCTWYGGVSYIFSGKQNELTVSVSFVKKLVPVEIKPVRDIYTEKNSLVGLNNNSDGK